MGKVSIVAGALALAAAFPVSAWSADGCPPGTANTTPSGGGAFSTLFDKFVAYAGDRTSCNLSVATGGTSHGEEIRVYTADYRGVMTLGNGDRGTLTTQQGNPIDSRRFNGSYDGDLDTRTYVGTDQEGNINSAIAIDLSSASDPLAFASVDTVDYAFAAGTTRREISRSLSVLADERTASALGLQSLGGLLAGAFGPQDDTTSLEVLGGFGSPMLGARGRLSSGNGFSISGGATYFEESAGQTTSKGVLISGALRYLPSTEDAVRPYAEFGGRVAPQDVDFTRRYSAGLGQAVRSQSSKEALSTGLYLQGGAVIEPDRSNQVVVSIAYNRDWTSTNASSEDFGPGNLFAATYADADTTIDTASGNVVWTRHVSPSMDITVNAGAGYVTAKGDIKADVSFAGDALGYASNTAFATYGASLKYRPSSQLAIEAFLQGVTAERHAVTPTFGGSLRLQF